MEMCPGVDHTAPIRTGVLYDIEVTAVNGNGDGSFVLTSNWCVPFSTSGLGLLYFSGFQRSNLQHCGMAQKGSRLRQNSENCVSAHIREEAYGVH